MEATEILVLSSISVTLIASYPTYVLCDIFFFDVFIVFQVYFQSIDDQKNKLILYIGVYKYLQLSTDITQEPYHHFKYFFVYVDNTLLKSKSCIKGWMSFRSLPTLDCKNQSAMVCIDTCIVSLRLLRGLQLVSLQSVDIFYSLRNSYWTPLIQCAVLNY